MKGRPNAVSARRSRAENATITLTMVIATISESSSAIDQLGDLGFFDILQYYVERAKHEAKAHRGRMLKRIYGGGFIAIFGKAEDAVDFATGFINSFVDKPSRKYPVLANLHSQIGIHSGEVTLKKTSYGDDVFGNDVILCARMEERAKSGQVVISDSAYTQLTPQKATHFTGPEEYEADLIKGIKTPVRYWTCSIKKGGAE